MEEEAQGLGASCQGVEEVEGKCYEELWSSWAALSGMLEASAAKAGAGY